MFEISTFRTPAKAGVQARRGTPKALSRMILQGWIPAFAGMTVGVLR